jgi:hypothetical protein
MRLGLVEWNPLTKLLEPVQRDVDLSWLVFAAFSPRDNTTTNCLPSGVISKFRPGPGRIAR